MTTPVCMRKKWFEHVEKTRRKMKRTEKNTTHRQAMTAASQTWPTAKVKILNKIRREKRKQEKEAQKNVQKSEEHKTEDK